MSGGPGSKGGLREEIYAHLEGRAGLLGRVVPTGAGDK